MHTNIVLHLHRYHLTITSVMLRMVKFETFNSSFNSCFAASCIANVHLNSLDNINWTLIFWKTFLYINYLYRYQQFQQEWPI